MQENIDVFFDQIASEALKLSTSNTVELVARIMYARQDRLSSCIGHLVAAISNKNAPSAPNSGVTNWSNLSHLIDANRAVMAVLDALEASREVVHKGDETLIAMMTEIASEVGNE